MKSRKSKRGGFTLVEMLTVLVIIGVLASMIAGAVMFALNAVNQTVIRQEISQLEMALDTYKNEYGEYPPDNADHAYSHILRYYRNVNEDHANQVAKQVNPSTALYIFLGPKSADPKQPFLWSTTVHQKSAIMDFSRDRVKNTDGSDVNWGSLTGKGQICPFMFMPRGCALPYIYFRGNMVNGTTTYDGKNYNGAVAYADKHGIWYGDHKFQIISAGADNVYHDGGGVKVKDDGGNDAVTKADLDNIVSFSTRQIRDLLE